MKVQFFDQFERFALSKIYHKSYGIRALINMNFPSLILANQSNQIQQIQNYSLILLQYISILMSLQHNTAIRRRQLIRKGSIQYNFHIILQPTRYHGLAEITFYLQTSKIQQDLQIDFSGKIIQDVIINNFQVQINNSVNFIYLPRAYLQKGRNRVSILYQNIYDIDLTGCISFYDKTEQFIFTDFQPYYANRVFPCFDQPDLKATMKLTVVADQTWRVLSNQIANLAMQFDQHKFLKITNWSHQKSKRLLINFAKKIGDNPKNITTFPETKLLSSYLLCFAAGKFIQIPAPTKTLVPMSLFCPPSVEQNLRRYSDFIFEITIKCMDFFGSLFDVIYPFSKYDQLFIRECHALAMQNAGIVTFNEPLLLPKQNETLLDYYNIGLVVSHQLSHHWFGNYVTMEWWDDLWLNQSFAEWISCYSIQKLKDTFTTKKFQSSYLYFRDTKVFGYQQDERNNYTHPIKQDINNTNEALSIFDGITYNKGASVLKQLTYLVKENFFQTALSSYFKRFAWGNATLDDLLQDLKTYFPSTVNVLDWKQSWLLQASVNIFTIDWDFTNSNIIVNQSSFNNNNILRAHQVNVALFNADGTYSVISQQLIKPVQKTTINYSTIPGSYSAVLVNHEDYTYVENIIDPDSLSFFMNNIDLIKDLFTRMNIWYNIRSMVNLSYIPLVDYVAMIQNKLFQEPSTFILERNIQSLLTYLNNFTPDTSTNLKSKIFGLIYQALQNATDTQTQKIQILKKYYIFYAQIDSQITSLQDWLLGNDPNLSKRILDFDQKWQIIKKIFTLQKKTLDQKWLIFSLFQTQDQDKQRVQDAKIICNVLAADQTYFEVVYNEFKNKDVSLTIKRLKAIGWRNNYHSQWIIDTYQQRYYKDIIVVSKILSYEQFQFFYTKLRPIDNNLSIQIEKYNKVIDQLSQIDQMEQHCSNLKRIIDDLALRIKNIAYNADINNALSQIRADLRYDYIEEKSIGYTYHISFVKNDNHYTGMAQITFSLTKIPTFLPLQFIFNKIYSLNVNGKLIYPNKNAEFLFIYSDYLILGSNFISIHYKNQYNNDGLGCMFYIETVSIPNAQYIYTKFQPYGAHRFVPCFDQPDLKAKAVFNVIVPDGWMAASNQDYYHKGIFSIAQYQQYAATNDKLLLQAYLQQKQGTFYTFYPTQNLPTYLYCVVAGQYYIVTASSLQQYKNIPMNLYCIQSYSPALDRLAPFIFQMTTLSLQLYQTNFGVKYPFKKYDSVFCHEFKSGAMQNPGIITFNDSYLYPQAVSLQKMLDFANTVVHQNSHNWFGNYVTMKWWDDLWLNQSFADFIAAWCLQQIKDKVTTIPKYDSGWKVFLVEGVGGYRQDQITQTTHAVRSTVENTSVAQTYFDRITYQKGSAVLKQLMFLMGQSNFFKGVQKYFVQFGWKNGTIDDFLINMQQFFQISQFTLNDWKNSWLITPSLNVFSIEWDLFDISTSAILKIYQSPYALQYPYLRYHKTRIAMFKSDFTYDTFDIFLSPTASTIFEYDGSKNYMAVLLNVDYWGYFKYIIDPISLTFFKANMNMIPYVLTRIIIWHDINEQVRDSNFKFNDFKDMFLKYIFIQTDDRIFQFQYNFMKTAVNNYIPIKSRPNVKSQIFQATYDALKNAPVKDNLLNRNKLLKDQLTSFATTADQVDRLEQWRKGTNIDLSQFPITTTQAWQVVKLVYSQDDTIYTLQEKKDILTNQTSLSPGIKAQLIENTCKTIMADAALLSSTYDSFKQMNLSLDAKASFAEGCNNFRHLDELSSTYKSKYFTDLPGLSKTLISNHFAFFYQNLKPIDDELQETISSYQKIKLQGSNMIGHIKVLKQISYNYQLRLKIYANNS